MSQTAIQLIRRDDDALVEAILCDGLGVEQMVEIENDWHSERGAIRRQLGSSNVPVEQWPQSLHWDWAAKSSVLQWLEATGFGIQVDGNWQGAMLTKTASCFARLPPDPGKPLVYIDYLEVAPWNLTVAGLGQRGRYKGIGSILIRAAVRQSLEEGFEGRVGLHALPQSESFYKHACGMTEISRDRQKQGLLYFEFSPDQAQALMRQGGAR